MTYSIAAGSDYNWLVMPSLVPLPIDEVLPAFARALSESASVVLRAPPGAGKTTRVPPAMLSVGIGAGEKILVLQPRRVAARATAARIAAEHGWRLGEEVGYQVRFESRTSSRTRIEIITEGILLRRLSTDPFLNGIGAVVFDEFHERSLASDLALAMVRQVQTSVRPELRIVVMSATLAAEPIAAYLGGAPVVESAGRTFPVDVRYQQALDKRPIAASVTAGVAELLAATSGDLLVFLPGLGEIRECERAIAGLAEKHDLAVHPLYGDLPAEEQDAVLRPGPRRKVILSTNVAETSLTIEGVTGVVDSGLARVLKYDERTGLDRLELGPISKASAEQRAGRAGRTQPGVCLRLWPEAAQRIRPEYELPEIQRVDLAGAVLQVLAWIEPDLAAFPWFEPPSAVALERARELLVWLGAADDSGAITPLGRELVALPVHPRIGRLLVEGQRRGIASAAALAAAILSERDPFLRDERPRHARTIAEHSRSDLLDRVHALQAFDERGTTASPVGELHRGGAKSVLRVRDQLVRLVADRGTKRAAADAIPEDDFLQAVLAAFPDRLARRREPGSRRGVMVGGRGVRLAENVALADEELYVCTDVDAGSGEALVRQASAVDRAWLPRERLTATSLVEFDERAERVVARKQVRCGSLVIEESLAPAERSGATAAALAEAAIARWDRVFPADEPDIAAFVTRVNCLAEWMPDLGILRLDTPRLQSLLADLSAGKRSLAELRSAPWLAAIKGLFTWQQLQQIDREVPERIEVPSGSKVAVTYEVGRPPVLAVRIQEVFGLAETPRIAGGRVRVLMHLLAPNMRVAQVTDDLASFWANTYAMVRKDLRARYPKHSWPEDPRDGVPQRRPGKKT
ncbi:MAG: ATP-dependent helicase HrpB [Pirellulaceae bacterium]|nr:ATP-dependent helicase HrpB [Pirellulaceae bacterium]